MPALDQLRSTSLRGPHRPSAFWACTWYASTLVAWLMSWGMERLDWSSAAGLTSLAIFTELVGAVLRWRSLARDGSLPPSESEKHATELVWLCAWGAQANALGLVAMLSPELTSMLPALIITAVVETLLVSKSPLARKGAGPRAEREAVAETAPPELEILSQARDPAVVESEAEHWTRSTHEGRGEGGERFLGGWVRFELAADQKTLTLTVGFSPTFATAPEVELDQELDSDEAHCEARLEHVTPAGMRVLLKRTSTGAPLSGKLLWHASESDHSPSLLASRLP